MAVLHDDLLDISRITRGTMQRRLEMTEIAAVVDAAVKRARPFIEAKRHKVLDAHTGTGGTFCGRSAAAAEILANLLTNAAKYTDAGDGLTCARSASKTRLRLPSWWNWNPRQRAVFEMFSRLKSSEDRSENGLGLGLSLSRGLAELHGGTGILGRKRWRHFKRCNRRSQSSTLACPK